MAVTYPARSHEEIRQWAESRGGRPALRRDTGLPFLDYGPTELPIEPVDWERFFAVLDREGLDFQLDPDGESRLYRLVRDALAPQAEHASGSPASGAAPPSSSDTSPRALISTTTPRSPAAPSFHTDLTRYLRKKRVSPRLNCSLALAPSASTKVGLLSSNAIQNTS